MATDLANLLTRRSAICAELAALSTSAAGGKPNAIDAAPSVDHQGYKKGLYEELQAIDAVIASIGGPVETEVIGVL